MTAMTPPGGGGRGDSGPPRPSHTRVSGARFFDSAVGVTGEPPARARMHRRILWKWPAAELGAAVVLERLLELGARVHDERSVLRHRLTDRAPLQEQDLYFT